MKLDHSSTPAPQGPNMNSRGWNPRCAPEAGSTLEGLNRLAEDTAGETHGGLRRAIRPLRGRADGAVVSVGCAYGYSRSAPTGRWRHCQAAVPDCPFCFRSPFVRPSRNCSYYGCSPHDRLLHDGSSHHRSSRDGSPNDCTPPPAPQGPNMNSRGCKPTVYARCACNPAGVEPFGAPTAPRPPIAVP
jgi:hypothetical protein